MITKAKIFAIGFLALIMHLGVMHTAEHDLHDLGKAQAQSQHDAKFHHSSVHYYQHSGFHFPHHTQHENEIGHNDCECLLGETPLAKLSSTIVETAFFKRRSHDVPPALTRHASTQYSKASPRAPPVYL